MKQETLKYYSDEKFRRVTGVKRETFGKMMEILTAAFAEKRKRCGRKPKLSLEQMLPATLEYLREYRTYAHIAASCGIAESNIYRTIKWVEDTLVKSGTFSPPGKKALLEGGMGCEVVLVDATETPVERPKKNRKNTIRAKRSGTR